MSLTQTYSRRPSMTASLFEWLLTLDTGLRRQPLADGCLAEVAERAIEAELDAQACIQVRLTSRRNVGQAVLKVALYATDKLDGRGPLAVKWLPLDLSTSELSVRHTFGHFVDPGCYRLVLSVVESDNRAALDQELHVRIRYVNSLGRWWYVAARETPGDVDVEM